MRSVRAPVIPFLLSSLLALAPACARADVIHLKNGRTIWADHVHENGTHIEYDVGDNIYVIQKSSVERIDAGFAPHESASTPVADHDLPTFSPADSPKNDPALINRIIRDNRVDEDALSAAEQTGNPATASAAYFIAGKHEFERGNLAKARTYLDTALRFDGQNPTTLNYYAALLVRTGNATEALQYAERAVRIAPDSADTLSILGYAQFAADRNQDAIRTLKRALEIRPDPAVQQLLAKAERQATAQTNYSERESSHFTLHYEGQKSSESLRGQLLAALESDYDDLVRDLGVTPRSSIPVVLYTDQAFFDVTQAPSWSGAINDGKLQIPIRGLDSVTPELAHVLKHELAHSFINQLTGGRCPQWLNEGIAQLVEPKMLSNGGVLAKLYGAQQQIPLNMLEGTFVRFSGVQATLAYAESLAATQYIADSYGMSDLQRILQKLGEGSSTEAALRAVLHSDYGQLETEISKYLAGKYGS